MPPAFTPPTPLHRATPRKHPPTQTPRCTAAPQTPQTPPQTPHPSPPAPLHTPTHRRLPVIGFLLDVYIRNQNNITQRRRYGPVYKTDLLGLPITVISSLPAINACYRDTETFRSAGAYPPSFSKIFGQHALFITDGPAHTAKRARILPAFSPQFFPSYFPAMNEASHSLWTHIAEDMCQTPRLKLVPRLKDHYLRVILRLTAGETLPQFDQMRDHFIAVSAGMLAPSFTPAYRAAQRSKKRLTATLATLTRTLLAQRAPVIDALRASGDDVMAAARAALRSKELDLLTVLCASSPLATGEGVQHDPAALQELAEMVLLLWFAGSSTQATSTACCVLEAARGPGIWERLRDEQDAIVAANSGDRQLSFEQVSKQMPLLDSFITEILRMYPAAAGFFRKVSKDVMVCGHKIEKGTFVSLDAWGSQRDPEFYPDPDTVKVDRFLGNQPGPQSLGINSFGVVGGAHFCIGAALARINLKTTLGTLFRDYELVLDPDQKITYRSVPEMIPTSGVVITGFERRKVATEAMVSSQTE